MLPNRPCKEKCLKKRKRQRELPWKKKKESFNCGDTERRKRIANCKTDEGYSSFNGAPSAKSQGGWGEQFGSTNSYIIVIRAES